MTRLATVFHFDSFCKSILVFSFILLLAGLEIIPVVSWAIINGQPAATVLGQPNFTSKGEKDTAQNTLNSPQGNVFDSSGNLWVADSQNNRVLMYSKTNLGTNGAAATMVLGQNSFTSKSNDEDQLSASSLNNPGGIAFDSAGNLWVADSQNNRVLMYSKGSGFTTDEAATVVLGQSDFVSNNNNRDQGRDCGNDNHDDDNNNCLSASTLNNPGGIAFDSAGNLWVADSQNNRVLMYSKTNLGTNGAAATMVLGQNSFTSKSNDEDQLSASSLNNPGGIAFDSAGNLWVADSQNNRVLMYSKGSGFTTDEAATVVLGQSDFVSNNNNRDQGRDCGNDNHDDDNNNCLSASTLNNPGGIAFDSAGNLWVADSQNNRVLMYSKGSGFTTDEAATVVLGQSDFVSNNNNRDQGRDCGNDNHDDDNNNCLSASTLNNPGGIAFDSSGKLAIADTNNNRVLVYDNVPAQTTAPAASALAGDKISLSWNAPISNGYSITGYEIDSSTDGGTTWSPVVANTASSATSYTVSGLTSGTLYQFRIEAINQLGTGSAGVSSLAVTAGDVPAQTTAPAASALAGDKISLSWNAPISNGYSITGYEIDSSTDGGTTWSPVVANTASSATSYTVSGLTSGTLYQFRIEAINQLGTGSAGVSSLAVTAGDVPAQTTGLTLSMTSTTSASLSWIAPISNSYSIIQYEIDYSTDGNTWTEVPNAKPVLTSYTVSSLTSNTLYYFRVSAINELGTGNPSSPISTTTLPLSPPNIAATTVSDSKINLSWAAPSGTITGYKIERSIDGSTWSAVTSNTGTATTSYSDTGLNPSTTYYYRIFAIGDGGTGSASSIASATTTTTAPSSLSATSISTSQINLSWAAPSGTITGYEIERSIDGSTWSAVTSNTGTATTSYSDTGLLSNTMYIYRVSALSSGGQSLPSGTSSTDTYPDPPSPISTTAKAGEKILLSWTPPSGTGQIRSYKIERSTDGNNWPNTPLVFTFSNATAYVDSGLTINDKYFYKISSINAGDTSLASSPTVGTVAGDVPAQTTAPAASALAGDKISLSWNAPISNGYSITGYEIDSSTDGGTTWSPVVANTASSATSYTVSGLTSGTLYQFRIEAINQLGTGSAGVSSLAVTAGDVPAQTTAPTIMGQPGGSVFLSWIAPISNGYSIIQYEIDYSTDGTTWSPVVANTASSATSYTVSGLTSGTLYQFRIEATNALGTGLQGLASNTLSIENNGPQIISLVAGNPASAGYSSGATINVQFNEPTNQPAVATKGDLDNLFAFSQPIGTSYTGQWLSSSELLITIKTSVQTAPTTGANGLTLTVNGAANLKSADGTSLASTSTSPPLSGSFGTIPGPYITTLAAFNPTASNGYTSGVTITIRFSDGTNRPGGTTVQDKAGVDALFSFSQNGQPYSLGTRLHRNVDRTEHICHYGYRSRRCSAIHWSPCRNRKSRPGDKCCRYFVIFHIYLPATFRFL
ncbi:hypothetical protein DYY67_0777 [Candidatus Nitrosotalea sp. TS]|uniref:fibronectin type III domain-containing protein n=1 Tax=Candidatus Nitrosotalea sp. TS TaxID=2341020 RepID=UPI0014099C86|nr:fibronectin type III domain-containing protein [Candidatus Nitrosotalea sp. TS]NHI03707.1 hypothetical protein [Candidatus Nitrosotalea sp. TS]